MAETRQTNFWQLIVTALITLCTLTAGAVKGWSDAPRPSAATVTLPTYQVQPDWPALDVRERLGICSGVAVNSKSEVFVVHRADRTWKIPLSTEAIPEATILVIDAATGKLLRTMGANLFALPHGIFIDREDNVWVTDLALHQVFKLSASGEVLAIIGESRRSGTSPQYLDMPTDVAQLSDGTLLISDGYQSSRVIRFDPVGRYLGEWGRRGKAPGEFLSPHSLDIDAQNRVFICDRYNSRIQIMDAKGNFSSQWDLRADGEPRVISSITMLPDGKAAILTQGPQTPATPCVLILSPDGSILEQFGHLGSGPGEFSGAHDIAATKEGILYTTEIVNCRVQKFVPRLPLPKSPPTPNPEKKR